MRLIVPLSVRSVILAVAVAAAVCCRTSSGIEVQFTVQEPTGAARAMEVVSGGIPLPEGKYKDPAQFSLFDGGQEAPVQVSPIVKYPDGSMHWVLVSFPATLGANESKTFTLKDAPGKAKPANPVVVTEKGAAVEVSNGIVSFRINKDDFNGFDSISYKGKEVFKAAKAALTADGKGGPGKLTHFEYAYRGPVRVTLYLKGTYDGAAAPTWSMIVTLNAGESVLRVEHNLRNGGKGAGKKTTVADPTMFLGLAGDLSGGESGSKGPGYGWKHFSGAADVLVFMRHGGRKLKGEYNMDTSNGELAIHLSGTGNTVNFEFGEHKATGLDFSFGKVVSVEALSGPLHALASCGWYAAHDTMGVGRWFGSYADETATYKACGWKNADDPKKMQKCASDPAFYKGSIGDVHFTTECDHLQGTVFGYLRTGQRGFFDEARGWAAYWRTYFVYRSNEWIYGKEGSYNTPKWGSPEHSRGCTEGCHNYGSGLFNYALITGDIDALEAAFDCAEFVNLSWTGQYSKLKPGQTYSTFGTRGFARNFVIVARAFDVARTPEWKDVLHHHIAVAMQTPARDPRGFTTGSMKKQAADAKKNAEKSGSPAAALLEKEGVEVGEDTLKHPKYGEWIPRGIMTWPETILNRAVNMSYPILVKSDEPADHIAAEDLMDHAIAQAYCGAKYVFHPIQKTVGGPTLDFPIPDYAIDKLDKFGTEYQAKGPDSWYTKWWPNVFAVGYRLTGDKTLREKAMEVLWWGLARDFVNPPKMPEGDAPLYSRVEKNTKGDWMTPVCLVFGITAFPKKEEAPPAAVTDLKAVAAGGGKVELSWTAPGDEGGGSPMRYQVKWSEKPLVDYLVSSDEYRSHFKNGALDVTYWTFASNVAGEPAPQAKGRKETMTLSVPAGKTLHFGVRTFDDSHNRSGVSNVASVEVK